MGLGNYHDIPKNRRPKDVRFLAQKTRFELVPPIKMLLP